jgi:hypothetical protein
MRSQELLPRRQRRLAGTIAASHAGQSTGAARRQTGEATRRSSGRGWSPVTLALAT